MSEAKSSKKRSKAKTESAPKAESAPKTESAPKAEAKSESADATPKAKDDAASTPPEVVFHRHDVVGRSHGRRQGGGQ